MAGHPETQQQSYISSEVSINKHTPNATFIILTLHFPKETKKKKGNHKKIHEYSV
jgi:hypothetical protein